MARSPRLGRCGRNIAVLLAGLACVGCREKWYSYQEFDVSVLEGRSFHRSREYGLEEAKRVAGAYIAHLAGVGSGPVERPYTACVDPEAASGPFRFVDGSFRGGWIDMGAALAVEFKTGTRLQFCFDLMVVNLSRFPCFQCSGEKSAPLHPLNVMRGLCGEPPIEAADPRAVDFLDRQEAEALRRCHVSP